MTVTTSPARDRSNPPGPTSGFGLSSLVAFRRDMLGFLGDLKATHGDVVAFKMLGYHLVLLSDPNDVRDVLVTNAAQFTKGRALKMSRAVLGDGLLTAEGDFHRRQRQMIQPVFHTSRMGDYARVMTECADRFGGAWDDGATVDMVHEMRRVALAIVSRTLFGTDETDAEAETLIDAISTMMSLFTRVSMPFARLIGRLPLPSNRRFKAAQARVDETLFRMIAAYRADAGRRTDLLSRLIEARADGDGDGGTDTGADRSMSDAQIRDEMLTLFAAGHETTALAMAWTWYLLSEHPEVAARLHRELAEVLGGRAAQADDVARLPFTNRVLTESMRLFPPAYAVGRTAEVDYPVRDYVIPKGTTVLVSQYLMHRDPRFFPSPERFDPDRWTDAFTASLPRCAYFPFGDGPRICIGASFARYEAVIVLATLAQRWRATLVPGHPVEPHALMTLRPKHGLRMTLQRRDAR